MATTAGRKQRADSLTVQTSGRGGSSRNAPCRRAGRLTARNRFPSDHRDWKITRPRARPPKRTCRLSKAFAAAFCLPPSPLVKDFSGFGPQGYASLLSSLTVEIQIRSCAEAHLLPAQAGDFRHPTSAVIHREQQGMITLPNP